MSTAAKPREKLTLRDTTDLLVSLNQWIEDHVDELELNGGALPDDLAAMLDEIVGSQRDRADAIAFKIDEFLGYATAAKATKDRSARREKVWNNTVAAMKAYVLRQLDTLGVDRIRGVTATLRRQINSAPTVECELSDAELMQAWDYDPEFDADDGLGEPRGFPLIKYLNVRTIIELDKRELGRAFMVCYESLAAEAAAAFADANEGAQWVEEQLAKQFPGVRVTRGSHLRIE